MSAALITAVSKGHESHSHALKNPSSHHAHSPEAQPHPAEHPAKHGVHKHHPHVPVPKKGVAAWTWQWFLVATIVAGGVLLAVELPTRGLPHLTGAELSHQIELAAKGTPLPPRKDGITIHILTGSGVNIVTAEAVPAKLCVSAGWDLAKDGTLSVNGITPMRISAARLAELCNANPPATLVWTPEPAE